MTHLSNEETKEAKALFKEWFRKHPDIKNPTDVNREEKYDWCMKLGWREFSLMQKARKSNIELHDYPHPWTKSEYWKGDDRLIIPEKGTE